MEPCVLSSSENSRRHSPSPSETLAEKVERLESKMITQDVKIENLRQVCKLQQKFFEEWENEHSDILTKVMPKDGEPIAPTKQKSDYNHLSVSRDW